MQNKIYPGLKNAIILCIILLGVQVLGGIIIGIPMAIFEISEESLFNGVGMILISIISFGVVIFIGFKKSKKSFNEVFMFNNVSLYLWISTIIFMIGFVILSSELDNLLQYVLPMPQLFQDLFQSLLVNEYIIISIILVGIIPAFVEEMLFRGVILSGFTQNYSMKKSILLSALLFGLIHLNPWQFVTAFIVGIITAWLFIKTKSIILCVYIHLFNNILAVIALKFSNVLPIRGFNTAVIEHSFQPLWFNAIGLVFTAAGAFLLIKGIKKQDAE